MYTVWPLENVTTIWSLFSDKLLYYVSKKYFRQANTVYVWFLKNWPLPIKDNIRDNDFELPRISTFILTHTHCYSHMYTYQKLGKGQRHRKWDSLGFAVWCYIEQFNEIIITYPTMFVDLQREMSNRKSSVWKIGTIFPLYSLKCPNMNPSYSYLRDWCATWNYQGIYWRNFMGIVTFICIPL